MTLLARLLPNIVILMTMEQQVYEFSLTNELVLMNLQATLMIMITVIPILLGMGIIIPMTDIMMVDTALVERSTNQLNSIWTS